MVNEYKTLSRTGLFALLHAGALEHGKRLPTLAVLAVLGFCSPVLCSQIMAALYVVPSMLCRLVWREQSEGITTSTCLGAGGSMKDWKGACYDALTHK